MALKSTFQTRDPVQFGKMIVKIITGTASDVVVGGEDEAAAQMGQKGGKALAALLSQEERAKIAQVGAKARWAKKADPSEVS